MLRRLLESGLAVSLLIGAAPADAAMHATGEFEAGATRPRSVVFLPPQATLLKQKVVKAGKDPELEELVLGASRGYAEMLTRLRLKLPRQIGKQRNEAGDEMRSLAAKLGVDAVGFAEIEIAAAAAGATVVSGFTGFGSAGSSTLMSVSVIDGATANIEAFFIPPVLRRGSMAGYDAIMADPAGKIGELTEATLRDLPKADTAALVVAESDEDVLSDVEDLLEN
jgi:hypothetical protein